MWHRILDLTREEAKGIFFLCPARRREHAPDVRMIKSIKIRFLCN